MRPKSSMNAPTAENLIVASRGKWFARGLAIAVLISGAANAVSYFGRSDGWGKLTGSQTVGREAIGFPFEIWEGGNTYNGFYVDYPAVLGNITAGVGLGLAIGALAVANVDRLNRIGKRLEMEIAESELHEPVRVQFSIRTMLAATAVAACLAALAKSTISSRPEFLIGIYLLGPALIVSLGLAPRNIPWQQRVAIVIPLTVLLMAAAIGAAGRLPTPLPFEQVILGVFVCWTPQCVAAASALTAAIFFQAHRSLAIEEYRSASKRHRDGFA